MADPQRSPSSALSSLLIDSLVRIGFLLADAIGTILARRIQAMYASVAANNPTLQEPEITAVVDEIAVSARRVAREIRGMYWPDYLTKDEKNEMMRNRTWQEIQAREAAKGHTISENLARYHAEGALLEDRAEEKGVTLVAPPER